MDFFGLQVVLFVAAGVALVAALYLIRDIWNSSD